MTTEQQTFIDQITYLAINQQSFRIQDTAEGFFITNICIPKGKNRHPYADVLHAYIEDITLEIQGSYAESNFWKTISGFLQKQYRIKPSEPVYEWQWYRKVDGKVIDWSEAFRTEQENQDRWSKPDEWYKFEETKRERK